MNETGEVKGETVAPKKIKNLVLPFPLGQTVLDYLATRPYNEVYMLVAELQALEPVDGEVA